jgi:hypothetical protein
MDPVTVLGIAATAAQFTTLVVSVVKDLNQFRVNRRDAPVQVLQLQHEMAALNAVVSAVKFTLETLPNSISMSRP